MTNDGTFVVPDLATALRVAKDGNTIFLCDGTHNLIEHRAEDQDYTEVNKEVTIVGCHPVRCIVAGTFLKTRPGKLVFKCLSLALTAVDDFENISDPSPNIKYEHGGFFIREGEVVLDGCTVRSYLPNAIGRLYF